MTTQEKYDIVASQHCRAENAEWSTIDGQDISDMLNCNEVGKEHHYHDGLAVRTKVDSVIGMHSPELATAGSEKPDVKVEDGKSSVKNSMAYHLQTVEDEYMNHAEDLRNALHATAMVEAETENTDIEQEDLIDRNNSFEGSKHSSKNILNFGFPSGFHTCCRTNYYTPKTPFDANNYLHKIKTRFDTHPGIFTAFIHILKAYQAAPSPGPIHETHDAVRKLFWPHLDLIVGFGEWLPRPIEGGSGAADARGGVGDGVKEIEKEITDLKATLTILEVDFRALREKVGQMDTCTAGPRWVIEQLEKEVEGLKGDNEIMRMGIDGLMD
ncbi:hypothetical protein E6O75_ATG00887 [Venturia nashicola]|uniref:Uncharacterized protein n=1 Tax=Venturia nashicola TaxID=86259 RepID=A0A4Z1PFG0_9PEZI|nr:hypothetical protein E6O75_ATG00887 [Venturia nashicola]